jgi:hypothetical protein
MACVLPQKDGLLPSPVPPVDLPCLCLSMTNKSSTQRAHLPPPISHLFFPNRASWGGGSGDEQRLAPLLQLPPRIRYCRIQSCNQAPGSSYQEPGSQACLRHKS